MQLKINGKFNREGIVAGLGIFWKKIYIVLFFGFLIGAIGFGLYIWNRNLVALTWSAERKQQFIKTQERGVALEEDTYKKALEVVEKRRQELANPPEAGKDFFKAY
jgi:type IV secretory pathway TrbD component